MVAGQVAAQGDPGAPLVPFHSYLWKIASRCNIDCTYCYVYHLADQRFRLQPRFMSEETARQTARRIREHLEANGKRDLLITFHGGEPMLAGPARLARYLEIIDEEIIRRGFKVELSMQSNLTLFDEEIGEVLLRYKFRVGTSLDGPPKVNDLARVDHQGRPTSAAAERGLRLLMTPRYQSMYDGILCVLNPFSDPIAVVDHLLSFSPKLIDFLLPLGNHDRRPAGKQDDPDATPHGDWLIRAFDHWWRPTATSRGSTRSRAPTRAPPSSATTSSRPTSTPRRGMRWCSCGRAAWISSAPPAGAVPWCASAAGATSRTATRRRTGSTTRASIAATWRS